MSNEELPPGLLQLASALEIRKQAGQSTHLLLSSQYSLTPQVRRGVCGSESWVSFRRALAGQATSDKLNLLNYVLGQEDQQSDYQALAQLMSLGYFKTVITTNLDSSLEHALLDLGIGGSDLHVLIVGRERPEQIADILDNRGHKLLLLKLHGSLQELVLPERFPNLLELPPTLRGSLQRYFKHKLLVVGSVDQDDDLRHMFSSPGTEELYYVPAVAHADANRDDFLQRLMEEDPHAQQHILPSQVQQFFPTLLACLQNISSAYTKPGSPKQRAGATPTPPAEHSDVLLVTATDIETRSLLDQFGKIPPKHAPGSRTYYHLGTIGGARVALVQSEMGSSGQAGSYATVFEGIHTLKPRSIILLGIACGAKQECQSIGDILISRQLMIYDRLRIGTDPETHALDLRARGDRVTASPRLQDRVRTGMREISYDAWEGTAPQVSFGLILSGSMLLDNQTLVDRLKQLEPETIGFEMEGAGLYEAATLKTDWVIIKAISDFGDGSKDINKSINQAHAARNAARFVLEILVQGGF